MPMTMNSFKIFPGGPRLRLRAAAFLFTLFLSSALAGQQTGAVPVTIHVADPTHAGIAGAQVRIVPAPTSASKLVTDARGELSVDLKPGGYAIFVGAQGFRTATAHLDVVNASLPAMDSRPPKPAQTFSIVLEVGASGSPTVNPISSRDGLTVAAFPYHDPFRFSFSDLRAMPHITAIIHNTHTNVEETYSGVRLADLLGKVGAPLGDELRGEALTHYIVATGADGYQVVLSLGEVDPAFHPGEVVVADTMNGKPLETQSGPLKLIVTEDKRPARSVRNLSYIELKVFP